MNDLEARRLQAYARLNDARQKEANARVGGGGPVAVDAAIAEAAKAQDELAQIEQEIRNPASVEETVTLIGPHPHANVVDANGVKFVHGRAEDVPRSLAEHYVDVLEGYEIEEPK